MHNYLSVISIGAGGNVGSHSTGRAGTQLWGLGSTHQCWVSDYHWGVVSSNIRYAQEQMLHELQADRKAKKKKKNGIFQTYIGVGERRAETSAILSPAPETHSIKTTY